MSTLCFGGSFNPIHNGHLTCARTVAAKLDFDRVLLIPSGLPPHKPAAADLAAAEHRLAMCRIVASADPLFQVTDLEIRRGGPSYTLQTARELKSFGMTTVNWLIGADMLNFLPMWHEAAKLLEEVNFIVIARPGYPFEWTTLPKEFQVLRQHVVEAPLVNICATEIRRKVRAGESIAGLIPSELETYIHQHHLYR